MRPLWANSVGRQACSSSRRTEASSGASWRTLSEGRAKKSSTSVAISNGNPLSGKIARNKHFKIKELREQLNRLLLLRERVSGEILLKVTFTLNVGKKKEIKERIDEILEERKKRHPPWDVACAGSSFKNPVLPDGNRVPAASLLDQVDAKKVAVGDAAVFKNHANFIINKKDASARNVLNLAQELKNRIRKKFGVELEEEVIFLPAKLSRY